MFGWKEILKLFGFSLEFGLSFWNVGSAISIGSSILGGAMGSDAAGKASGQQSAAMQQAINEINRIGNRTREDTTPYRNIGSASSGLLAALLGLNTPEAQSALGIDRNKYLTGYTYSPVDPSNFDAQAYLDSNPDVAASDRYGNDAWGHYQRWGKNEGRQIRTANYDDAAINAELAKNPTYGSLLKNFTANDLSNDLVYQNGLQFGLDNGNKGIMNQARALGGADSGSVLKALTRYGNDYATTKTSDAYNRFTSNKNNIYNMLTGQQATGQNAVNTDANTGSQLAQALSSAYGQIGNANSAGTVGSANAWSSALGNIGKIAAAGGGILNKPIFKW